MPKKTISVVTSLYYSEPYLDDFYARHKKTITDMGFAYEFVFVNDGSPDGSLNKAISLQEKDRKVKVIDLSRNFGQELAMITGLEHTTGDYIVTQDADLEEDPEEVKNMYQLIHNDEEDVDLVYGVRETRDDPVLRRFLSTLFYRIMLFLGGLKEHRNVVFLRLMTRRYADVLTALPEKHFFFAGMIEMVGFKQVPYVVRKTYKGATSYSFLKRLKVAINGVLSFTTRPLIFFIIFGFFISSLSFISALIIVLRTLFIGSYTSGWVSITVSIWFFGGVILLAIGVVGLYIGQIYEQVKLRPRTIIRSIYGAPIKKKTIKKKKDQK